MDGFLWVLQEGGLDQICGDAELNAGQQQLQYGRQLVQPGCCFKLAHKKSYQCSARMHRNPGSMSRGMRLSVTGMSSAIWDKKMCETAVWAATAGSGSVMYKPLISKHNPLL